MEKAPLGIRAHIYTGREQGLMVIGTAGSLRELASEINKGVSGAQEIENTPWPREVACAEISDSSASSQPYRLSFHVETSAGVPPTNVSSSRKPFYIIGALLPFAIVGLVSIFRWVAANAL